MKHPVTSFHLDQENHWVAELACGHFQHVRHNPPWSVRRWVMSEADRAGQLGTLLDCKKCDACLPPDQHPRV